MTREDFKNHYEKKGWSAPELARRWGYTAPTRIHQIAADVELGHKRAQSYIDMLYGLPNKKS